MKEKFNRGKPFNVTPEKALLIEKCNRFINQTKRAGYTLTLRQVYYWCIANDHIPDTWIDPKYNAEKGLPADTKNTIKNYKRLGDLIDDARYAGLIDWEAIEDRTRGLERVTHWESPAAIIGACASQYRIDKWANQPRYVEVWAEKDAVIGILEKVCRELDVPWFSCRGYTSSPEIYQAAKRLAARTPAQEPVVIYLGDHDPSGLDMTRDIESRINLLGRFTCEVNRIALTREQIEELQPPPNPAKTTDGRSPKYIAEHGDDSWELDALSIEYMDRIIRETVLEYRDETLWGEAVEEENEQRALMEKCSEQWEAIVNLLEGQD